MTCIKGKVHKNFEIEPYKLLFLLEGGESRFHQPMVADTDSLHNDWYRHWCMLYFLRRLDATMAQRPGTTNQLHFLLLWLWRLWRYRYGPTCSSAGTFRYTWQTTEGFQTGQQSCNKEVEEQEWRQVDGKERQKWCDETDGGREKVWRKARERHQSESSIGSNGFFCQRTQWKKPAPPRMTFVERLQAAYRIVRTQQIVSALCHFFNWKDFYKLRTNNNFSGY